MTSLPLPIISFILLRFSLIMQFAKFKESFPLSFFQVFFLAFVKENTISPPKKVFNIFHTGENIG
jgi:hypothetical protein